MPSRVDDVTFLAKYPQLFVEPGDFKNDLVILAKFYLSTLVEQIIPINYFTDYRRLVRKSPSLHGRKSTPNPKFLGTAEGYFVCHIGPNFHISLIYAFIGCT